MKEMLQLMLTAYNEYSKFVGTSLYIYFAVISMAYIFVKNKKIRPALVYFPVVLLLIFFNPIFVKILYFRFFSGTYWRILWILPVTIINAYSATMLIFSFKKQIYSILCAVMVGVVIIVSGRLIYSTDNFAHRKNWYKLPNVVEVIGTNIYLYSNHWYPTIIVPNELYCSMRQYSSQYRLLYGRDAEGYMSGLDSEEIQQIYEEMCKEEPDVELIINNARKYEVHSILFNMDYHVLTKDPQEYGCLYVGDTDNYRYYQIIY